MSSLPKTMLTTDEYLAIEREADYKSEYFAGEMFALAGTSRKHGIIVHNISREIGNQLLDRDCLVTTNDLRVKIESIGKYCYPDIVVTCGKEELEDEHLDTLLNPLLIIEVLSDSTESYDRGVKFRHYRSLASLKTYVLVAQNERYIEIFERQPNDTWLYSAINEEDQSLPLESITCSLSMNAVYAKVEFESDRPGLPTK